MKKILLDTLNKRMICLEKAFRSVPFRSVPFRSVPFRSVPFRSVPFRSVPFRSVPFRSVLVTFRCDLSVYCLIDFCLKRIILPLILTVLDKQSFIKTYYCTGKLTQIHNNRLTTVNISTEANLQKNFYTPDGKFLWQ